MSTWKHYARDVSRALGQADNHLIDAMGGSSLAWGIPKVSAACISKPFLAVVTLEFNNRDGARICRRGTRDFEMADRSQAAIQYFCNQVRRFQEGSKISRLVLRVGSDRGQYRAHSHAFKMEAALQMQPTTVEFVHTRSVIAWVSREHPILPVYEDGGSPKALKQAQLRAMEAAAFVFSKSHFGHLILRKAWAHG